MKDKSYWESYYSSLKIKNTPSSFLKDSLPYLKKGKLLDIASGDGVNASFLQSQGFNVECIDFSEQAKNQALGLFKENNQNIEYRTVSLDFYLAPIMKYESMILVNYKPHYRLFEEFKKGLVIGGTLLIENYTYSYLKANRDTELDVDDCFKSHELITHLIKGWNVLYYDERNSDGMNKVRAIVEKAPL